MEWRFSQIMNGLQKHAADIGQKMDENLGRLDHTLGQLIGDIVGLKKAVQQNREDIRELQENTDNVKHRLDRLEQELDSGSYFQTVQFKISGRDGERERKLKDLC